MPWSEGEQVSLELTAWSVAERSPLRRHLTVRSGPRGLELFRAHLTYAEELMPVFSSTEAAHEFSPCLDVCCVD
jgi:hypothetical protein